MVDKILASIWILALVGFMMVVTGFVNEPDLWIIVIIVLILGIIDFVKEIRENDQKSSGAPQPGPEDRPGPTPHEARSEGGSSGPQ